VELVLQCKISEVSLILKELVEQYL